MARPTVTKNYFGFSKGKITEASGLTFPENSMKDELNIDINYDGTIRRRRGLDYESGYTKDSTVTDLDSVAVNNYHWENAGEEGDNSFFVVRVGNTLRFYDSTSSAISSNLIGSCDFSSISRNTALSAKESVQFVFAKGFLFCVNRYTDPFYVEWDGVTTFSINPITLKIRDLKGVDDGLALHERPSSLSNTHKYNLYNQGWPRRNIQNADHDGSGSHIGTALSAFNGWVGGYPSNSDTYEGGISGPHTVGFWYKPETASLQDSATSEAPKGHYILDAFDQRRATASGIGSITDIAIDERPTVIGFFQGHLIFAGVKSGEFKDTIFVSQSLTDISKAGLCYSINDPTAALESSPLDTDGGTIRIEGLGSLISVKNSANKCVIISDSGVWTLRPSDDGIFTVNNVVSEKVTSSGGVGPSSVVEYESTIFYWGSDGIYAVGVDEAGLSMRATNLTEFTIQSDYLSISDIQKKYSDGMADTSTRKIYWVYSNVSVDDTGFNQRFNRALILDVRTGSFYDYEISALASNSPIMSGLLFKRDINTAIQSENVVVGADTVVVGADSVYIDTIITSGSQTSRLKVLTLSPNAGNYSITFSEFTNRDFVDWETEDGVGSPYNSYVETSYELVGDVIRDKQATYVFCYFNRTEENFIDNGSGGVRFDYPSSCLMQAKWDWTSTATANRWGDPQQVYRFRAPYISGGIGSSFDYSYDIIETKNKARGKGKALHIRFESEESKDFQLLGWAVEYTAEAKI